MSDENNKPKDEAVSDAKKKPYVKPAFRHEKVFETMALSCGKVGHTQHQCMFYRNAS
jgi:hypothetical protein